MPNITTNHAITYSYKNCWNLSSLTTKALLEDRNCAKNLTKILNKFYDDLLNRLNGFFLVLLKLLLVHFCLVIFTGTVPWFFNFLYYIILVITPICNTARSLLFRLKYGFNYRVKIEPELAEEQHLHHYWNPVRGKKSNIIMTLLRWSKQQIIDTSDPWGVRPYILLQWNTLTTRGP